MEGGEQPRPFRPVIQKLDREGHIATCWYPPDQETRYTFPPHWDIRTDGILQYSAKPGKATLGIPEGDEKHKSTTMDIVVHDKDGIPIGTVTRSYMYDQNGPIYRLARIYDTFMYRMGEFDEITVQRSFDKYCQLDHREIVGFKHKITPDNQKYPYRTAVYHEKNGLPTLSQSEPQDNTGRARIVYKKLAHSQNPNNTKGDLNLITTDVENNPLFPLFSELTIPAVVPVVLSIPADQPVISQ